jgi:hypothetical protein
VPARKGQVEAMRHQTTETVFHYFNGLRAGRSAPLRKEIDPSALTTVLPDLFILEKARDGIVRFRLAGTRVCTVLGREMRESPFHDVWDPSSRHRMRLAADTVLANRNAIEVAVTGVADDGTVLALEMLMLPLLSRIDRCDRIFGSLVVLDQPPPLDPVWRQLSPADMAFAPVGSPWPSQPGETIGVMGGLATRFGHLRVFEGGKRN